MRNWKTGLRPTADDTRRQREQNRAAEQSAADDRTIQIVCGFLEALGERFRERAGRSTSTEVAQTLEAVAEEIDELVSGYVISEED